MSSTTAATASLLATEWAITAGATTLKIRNRFVMAPMTRRQAPTRNEPVEAHALYYARRAKGGIGLVVTEGVHVNSTTAVDAPNTPQCRTEGQIAGWRAVAKSVHAEGSKIAMQLWHTGVLSQKPVCAGALGPNFKSPFPLQGEPKPLSEEELHEIAADFAATAVGAVKGADFDAVELHGGHGYLLDSFVSKLLNSRTDAYGGSLEKRTAFPALVVKTVRAALGPDVPIIYRFSQWSIFDYHEQKFANSAELGAFLTQLIEAGVNAFHPSTRRCVDVAFPEEHPTRTLAGWVKALSGLPTIAVGGVGLNHVVTSRTATDFVNVDPTPALSLVESSEVDALALGRMVLSNKDYANQLIAGKWQEAQAYNPEPFGVFGNGPLDW